MAFPDHLSGGIIVYGNRFTHQTDVAVQIHGLVGFMRQVDKLLAFESADVGREQTAEPEILLLQGPVPAIKLVSDGNLLAQEGGAVTVLCGRLLQVLLDEPAVLVVAVRGICSNLVQTPGRAVVQRSYDEPFRGSIYPALALAPREIVQCRAERLRVPPQFGIEIIDQLPGVFQHRTIILVVGGRSLIENFGAGVMLQARAPFEPGDEITSDDYTGQVLEVNSRVVVIQTLDNRRVYMPNTYVLQSPIVNLTHDPYRIGEVIVDVAYGSDLEVALSSILAAVKAAPEILDDPTAVVEIRGFAESGVTIRVRYAHESDILSEWAATNAAAMAVYTGLRGAGVTIPFPQRTLWWGTGSPGRDEPGKSMDAD